MCSGDGDWSPDGGSGVDVELVRREKGGATAESG
jgi:hypothetical protein